MLLGRQGRLSDTRRKGAAKPLFLGRAPPADGRGRRIYIGMVIVHVKL